MTRWLYLQAMIIPKHGLSFVGFCTPIKKGKRVWQGGIQMKGTGLNVNLSCVALQDSEGALVDASGWPGKIVCDAAASRKSKKN